MVVDAVGLCKEYVRGGVPFWAVKDACLSVGEGEFVCVVGRSGSGKSTLLNMVAGLLPPTSGTVRIGGQASPALGTLVGYIPQGPGLLPDLSVFDNVRLPSCLHKRGGDPCGRASFLLGEVGIESLSDCFPAQLSGGEARRALIARALMNEPLLIVADEPTEGLDEKTAGQAMALLRKIARAEVSILAATHDRDALGYCDRALEMREGALGIDSAIRGECHCDRIADVLD